MQNQTSNPENPASEGARLRRAFILTGAIAVALFFGMTQVSKVIPLAEAEAKENERPRVLFIISTGGFHHSSCEHAAKVILNMARQTKLFDVVVSNTTEFLNAKDLKTFDAVFFANTTGDKGRFPASEENLQALLDWVKAGGAFLGAHAATDTLKNHEGYQDMICGAFAGHPWHEDVVIEVEDPSHPAAWEVPSPWKIKDEIYIFKDPPREKVHVILRVKEARVKGKHDVSKGDYPVAWCRNYGKGRVFYTSLGHREDVWDNPTYQRHLIGGLRWALNRYAVMPNISPLEKSKISFDSKVNHGHPVFKSDWKRVFDGKNLNWGKDWEVTGDPEKNRKNWTVLPGGILQGAGDNATHIYHIKKKYKNFEYRADINIDPDGNSGMYFLCSPNNLQGNGQWKNWPNGFEAQINNAYKGDPKRSGTFYPNPTLYDKEIAKLLGYKKGKDDGNFWFNMHVIAVDDLFVIKLNGKVAVVHRANRGGDKKEGYFAFQMHHKGTVVKLKNIEVRELP